MKDRILRRPEVQHRTGLARSTLYERMSENQFPKPIPLGGRSVGWLESDIDKWLSEQAAKVEHKQYQVA